VQDLDGEVLALLTEHLADFLLEDLAGPVVRIDDVVAALELDRARAAARGPRTADVVCSEWCHPPWWGAADAPRSAGSVHEVDLLQLRRPSRMSLPDLAHALDVSSSRRSPQASRRATELRRVLDDELRQPRDAAEIR
jgi:hypothetical protein